MIACADCRATNAPGLPACAKCGAPLAGLRDGALASELRDVEILRALEGKDRISRRRRLHAFAGALTFFILLFLAGLPDSLLPANLLVNALISAGAGLPLGYLISRFNAGPVKGALISAGFFVILGAILAGGVQAVVWGALGLVPGALIGWHVELDA